MKSQVPSSQLPQLSKCDQSYLTPTPPTLTTLLWTILKKNPVIFSFDPQILPYLFLKDTFKLNHYSITSKKGNSNSSISSNFQLMFRFPHGCFERQSSYTENYL